MEHTDYSTSVPIRSPEDADFFSGENFTLVHEHLGTCEDFYFLLCMKTINVCVFMRVDFQISNSAGDSGELAYILLFSTCEGSLSRATCRRVL